MQLSNSIIEYIATFVSFLYYVYAMEIFLKRAQSSFQWKQKLLCAALFLFLTGATSTLVPNTFLSICAMLLLFIMALWLYQGSLFLKIFTILLSSLLDILITSGSFYFFTGLLHCSSEQLNTAGTYDRVFFQTVIFLAEFAVLYFISCFFTKEIYMEKSEKLAAFVFLISDFAVTISSYVILFRYSSHNKLLSMLCVTITFFMILCTFLALFLMHRMQLKNRSESEYQLLQLQLHNQERQILEYRRNEDNVRTLRHDLKRYLLSYQILLEQGKSEEVLADIHEMLGSRLDTSATIYSDNLLLNALLYAKNQECMKHGFSMQIHTDLPADYNDIETMVIIGNLLDNAIEAEEKEAQSFRSICFELVMLQNGISIVVQNYIKNSVLKSNPLLCSSKEDLTRHGIGLQSVYHLVKKQEGIMEIYEADHLFSVHIIL